MAPSIYIVGFGRSRGKLSENVEHYRSLAKPYASVSIDLLKPPSAKNASVEQIRRQTSEMLCARWPKRCHAVALSEEGRTLDSKKFAAWVGEVTQTSIPLVFNIGAAYGLSRELTKSCRDVISLSPLTFSHELSLLVLVEQIYRAFTILHGHPYHKE